MRILNGLFSMIVLLALFWVATSVSSLDQAGSILVCWAAILFLHALWFLWTMPIIPFMNRLLLTVPWMIVVGFVLACATGYVAGIVGPGTAPLTVVTQIAAFGDAIFCLVKLCRSMPQSIQLKRHCITVSHASAATAQVVENDPSQT
jgi:hypothetical protein